MSSDSLMTPFAILFEITFSVHCDVCGLMQNMNPLFLRAFLIAIAYIADLAEIDDKHVQSFYHISIVACSNFEEFPQLIMNSSFLTGCDVLTITRLNSKELSITAVEF